MSTKTTKSESLRVRLTEEEASSFKEFADSLGETRATLLRKFIRETINTPWPDLLHDEQSMIRVVVRYLAGISRNLNQVTAAINSGKVGSRTINEPYLGEIKQHVDDVKSEFMNYLRITRARIIVKNKEDTTDGTD